MFKTKITKKGQVTIPKEIRDEIGINRGDVLMIKSSGGKIVVEESKKDLMKLAGKWKWLDDKIEKEMKNTWRGWNAELMPGH
jgi:AbrB family looped-hinge helix DNA binding protein